MRKGLAVAIAVALMTAIGSAPNAVDTERAKRAVEDARKALDRGDVDRALVQYRKAVDIDPGNAEAQFNLATLLLRIGELAEVEQHLRAAQDGGYDKAEVEATLADFLAQRGEFGRLLDQFQEGDRRKDLEARIRTARGYAKLNLRQMQDAERSFAQGIARGQTGLAQVRVAAGDLAAAAELLERAVESDPAYPDAWVLLGRVRSLRGDAEGARAAFDTAIKLAPDNPIALLGRAALVIDSDELQAAKDVAASLDLAPDNWVANLLDATIKARHQEWHSAEAALLTIPAPEELPQALYLLSYVNLVQGRIEQADAAITHYLAIVAQDPKGIAIKAQVLMLRGKPAVAVDLLTQALARTPNDVTLLGLLSDAYARNHQGKEAAETLDRLSTMAPRDAGYRAELAQRRIAAGQIDAALADLAIARAVDPLSAKATVLTLQALITANRLDEATKTIEELRRDNPDSPLPETYLGAVALKRGDLPAAREHFGNALTAQPGFALAAIDLAQTYRLEKRGDDSRAVLDRFLQQDPGNVSVLVARAELETADGKGDQALAFLERARSSDPQALQPRLDLVAAYIKRGEPAKALAIARELDINAPRDPRAVAALGEAQLANNDKETALQTFEHLVQITDGAPDALIRLAGLLKANGNTPASYRTMRRALEGSPTDPAVQKAFFEFSVKNGMAGASADFVREIAGRRPENPDLDLLLGHLYESDGHFERATAAYQQGFAKRETGDFALAIARSQAQGPQPATALATMAGWLKRHPDDNAGRFYYSTLLTDAHRVDEAIAECERLRAADPKNAVFLNNLALLYLRKSDNRAGSTAEEAYALAPGSATIADTLGWILLQKGAVERGLKLLRQAAADSPNPATRYHLGVALSRAGLREEALNVLTELIASGAQFDDVAAAKDLAATLRN